MLTIYKQEYQWNDYNLLIYFTRTKTKKTHIICILFKNSQYSHFPRHPRLKTFFSAAKIQSTLDTPPLSLPPNLHKKNNAFGKSLLDNYFKDQNTQECASPFEKKIWYALCDISYGSITSYSDIARRIHSPLAHRAVGTAVGKNPFSLFVPCHRVVPQSSILFRKQHPFHKNDITTRSVGSYGGGIKIKAALLQYECNSTSL